MKYPIKIKDLIIECEKRFIVDGAEVVAYRLRCKLEDGTSFTAMAHNSPLSPDIPQEVSGRIDLATCSRLFDVLVSHIEKHI